MKLRINKTFAFAVISVLILGFAGCTYGHKNEMYNIEI